MPHLRELRRRPRAVLRERLRRHLQRPGPRDGRHHVRWLFDAARRRRGVRAARAGHARPGRRGAAAVRGDHDLLAAAAVERRPRQEGRHRRSRRPRPHGCEAGARDGCARRAVYDVAVEDRGRQAARRARSRDLEGRSADERAPEQLRLHPEHGRRAARPESVPAPAQARRHDDARRRAGARPSVAAGVQPDLQAPPPRGFADRRDRGNAGNARFLRGTRDHVRYRDDSDAADQHGLRADAEERREVPVRDRHGVAQAVSAAPSETGRLSEQAARFASGDRDEWPGGCARGAAAGHHFW
ncbi:hypothetical protein F01_420677 [Burkholderia cenocepacia]|nr:hypothetical protein F01_420677 [Burkholderia cenocepacia]